MRDVRTLAGVALLALAVVVEALNSRVLPHGSYLVVFVLLLWAGGTFVARGRGWKRPTIRTYERDHPELRPLEPGESYEDAVKLALVPNVPLADLWCQRLR